MDEPRWVTVARVGELEDGAGRRIEIDGIEIGLFRCRDSFYAVGDLCTHAEAFLHDGSVDCARLSVECPLHFAEFDLRTGEALTGPASDAIPVFPVRLAGDEVQVGLPSSA